MNFLAIETSTEACSVALVHGDEIIERSEVAPRRHAELVLPMADALPKVQRLYAALLAEEKRHAQRSKAVQAGFDLLEATLRSHGVDYKTFVFGLSSKTALRRAA